MDFTFEEKASDSSLVRGIWQTQSIRPGTMFYNACVDWQMLVTRYQGKTSIALQGPGTKATADDFPADAEWLGITFKMGVFMPDLPPGCALDRQDVLLPGAASKSFWLGSSAWEFPTYENADTFVNRLVRAGLLVRDPLIDDLLRGHPFDLTPRALQYRFRRATGLTYKVVQQIQRAGQAAALLEQGCSILDTADQLGYFDQSHLTNSLRRYMGKTPAQILRVLQTA
nr:transcriptional regulator, AraC family [uncultured bacterium]